ncbi:MAG: GNAT family N-acetyltransferase [Candidatus Wallbacteria bacterium]|nr:GNAT family N-acetyltransferase [Candidatus Wallbacteria bacterium]
MRGEPFCAAHRAEFCRLLTDPKVMGDMGGVRTPERAAALFEQNLDHWRRFGFGLWSFFERATDHFVGRGGLRHCNIEGQDELELGYTLDRPFWQRGLATEMAAGLLAWASRLETVETVVAFTRPYNLASRRVMEKLGFRYEREFLHDGAPHVLYRIALAELRAGARGEPRSGVAVVRLLEGAVSVQDLTTCEAEPTSKLPLGIVANAKGRGYYLNATDPCRSLAVFEFVPGLDPRGNHVHPTRQEFLFVVSGALRGRFWRSESPAQPAEQLLRPGQLLCVRPGIVHAYEALEHSWAVEFSAALNEVGDTVRG